LAKNIYTLLRNKRSTIEDKLVKENLVLKGILRLHSMDTISFNDYTNGKYKTSNAYTETKIVVTKMNDKDYHILFNGYVPESFDKEIVEYSQEFKDFKKVDQIQSSVILHQVLRLDGGKSCYECHKEIKFSKDFDPDKLVAF